LCIPGVGSLKLFVELVKYTFELILSKKHGDRSGRDHIVVEFTTTCAISAYHLYSCEFEPCSQRSVLDTTLCYKVCQ